MLQVVLNYRNGDLQVVDIPQPALRPQGILVRNVASVVSAGTEKLMMDLAGKSLMGKARARPDLVRQVVNKARVDGVMEAYRAATARLDTPVPLGYSCAGEVIGVGKDVAEFHVGESVACIGASYASHSEVVSVPRNLAVRVPEGVPLEEAAFCGVGAIALHAVRTADPRLGDRVAVVGLGLLGLLAVQLLKASGCSVFGVDLDLRKVALAKDLGCGEGATPGEDAVVKAREYSHGTGMDSVLIFASGEGNEAVELAAEMVREGGRLVVPGMVKLDLPRGLFYEKQIKFEVSRSAGPGMFDPQFQQKGVDYPLPYVRWTARRNVEQFVSMVASGAVNLKSIITHRFPIRDAAEAYEMLTGKGAQQIGVVLDYGPGDDNGDALDRVQLKASSPGASRSSDKIGVGLVGAGLFVKTTLSPILKGTPSLDLRGIATASGTTAWHAGDKQGFAYCTSDYTKLLADPDVDLVIIATRHNLHAQIAREALEAGKHVFVEKPLATDADQLRELVDTYRTAAKSGHRLMVGFNRRFSPFSTRSRELLERRTGPMLVQIRVNAGAVPAASWVNDPEEGGGRVIGEACHFVDLAQYLTGANPVRVYAESVGAQAGGATNAEDLAITLSFADGSAASIVYTALGDRSFPRERVEVFRGESVCLIDNFKSLQFSHGGRRQKMKRWNVDRGHRREFKAVFDCIQKGDPPPVPFRDYVYTTLTTFCILDSIRQRAPVDVDPAAYGLDLSGL